VLANKYPFIRIWTDCCTDPIINFFRK